MRWSGRRGCAAISVLLRPGDSGEFRPRAGRWRGGELRAMADRGACRGGARTDDFKFNVNLVLIDLFERLGLIPIRRGVSTCGAAARTRPSWHPSRSRRNPSAGCRRRRSPSSACPPRSSASAALGSRSKNARRTRVLGSADSERRSRLGAGGFQSRTTIELSCAPVSSVPSNSGSARNFLPPGAPARIAEVCAIGNSVPAGSVLGGVARRRVVRLARTAGGAPASPRRRSGWSPRYRWSASYGSGTSARPWIPRWRSRTPSGCPGRRCWSASSPAAGAPPSRRRHPSPRSPSCRWPRRHLPRAAGVERQVVHCPMRGGSPRSGRRRAAVRRHVTGASRIEAANTAEERMTWLQCRKAAESGTPARSASDDRAKRCLPG